MSHRQSSVSSRRARARGLAVLALVAGLSLPLLHATGAGTSSVDAVLALAREQVGDAYLWGGNGPDSWDCSGLTSYVWREAGGVAGMPRTAAQQQRWAVPIPREQLLPGDLAFFGDPVTHVALYVGDGKVVDASSARAGVLERALWTARDGRFGRVPRADMPAVAPWTPPTPSPSPSPSAGPASSDAPSAPPSIAPFVTPPATVTSASTPRPSATPGRPSASPSPTAVRASATSRPATVATPSTARPVATPGTSATSAPGHASPRPTAAVAHPPVVTAPAAPRPAPAPRPAARPASAPVRPLADLPARQLAPSSAVALKAVAAAEALVGSTSGDDLSLVRAVWVRAGGHALPTDRRALVVKAVQVPRPSVRVGDLVLYGTPSSQVYLYAGSGYLVGFSPDHGKVVVRRVHTGDVRFLRLPV